MPGNVPSASAERPTLTEADLAWIERWRPKLLATTALFVVDFGGVRAAEIGLVRRDLARMGARMLAARTLRLRALALGTPLAALLPDFSGPTAIVSADDRWRSVWQRLRASRLAVRRLFWGGRPWSPSEIHEIAEPLAAVPPIERLTGEVFRTSAGALVALSRLLRPFLQGPPLPDVSRGDLSQTIALDEVGPNRVAVMRLLRRQLGCSLQEAKSLVDRAPVTLDATDVDSLERFTHALRAAGALVREQPPRWFEPRLEVELPSEALFVLLPGLTLREGYRLRSTIFSSAGGRHSRTWAENTEGIHFRIGDALVSDGRAERWLYASLLLREIGDFAADWHGLSWRTHEITDIPPGEGFRWRTEPLPAEEMAPSVARRDDGSCEVRFCTLCRLGTERLLLHIDRYPPGSLDPQSWEIVLAEGGPGYVF